MRHWNSGIRPLAVGVLAVALALAAAGCGSDGATSGGPPSTAVAGSGGTVDYEKVVPDAQVSEGLALVRASAGQVQASLAAGDLEAAKRHAAEMQDKWYSFEATVRKNEKALYLQLEDALADVNAAARDNNTERLQRGVTAYDAAALAYREKHS